MLFNGGSVQLTSSMHNEVVKKRNLTITSMTAVLLATVAISILLTDDASARNQKYSDDNSQSSII